MLALRRTPTSWVFVGLICLALAAISTGRARAESVPLPAELTHTFNIPDYEITTDEAGFSHVVLDGFYSYGLPGDPDLPAAVTYLALPPSVPLESVTVEINPVQQVDLPDSYQIAPVGPYLRCDDDQDGEWGPHAASIVDYRIEGLEVTGYEPHAAIKADVAV